MSYLTQMAGLATHNFFSAAVGIVVAVALIRGIQRTSTALLGNFWVDMTRTLLYVLLPGAILYALLLVAQGVPQNLHAYTQAHTLDRTSQPDATQTIAQGPVASQEAIKMLGTNGGGFFNANSAHPFENPTPFSNLLQMLSIFLIPAGLTYTLGRMTGSPGHGWAVLAAMFVLFAAGFSAVYRAESQPHPLLHGVQQSATANAPGGNMEGKEVRFGISQSALFATITTDASCGAVNSVHDSYTALGGMVVLVNIMLGEVVFGGVGAGLYGILIMVVLSVFIAGLMVGRTPEYLGKKIEGYDVKMSMLYVLIFPLIILTLTAIFVLSPTIGLSALTNQGPHGLTEILYAFTSAVGNNGSAFAGLSANTWWYNVVLGWAMLAGRFLMLIPVLALAGNLAQKKSVPPSPGTFPVNTSLFTVLLTGVIVILGALTFFPVLSLGPILEHLLLKSGRLF
jgi:K+-transporting ATPase ATPase A chain